MLHKITVLLPFLLLVSAAHLQHPSHRHQNIIKKSLADVSPRENEGHRDAQAMIKRQVIRRGQTCRVRPSASSSSSDAATSTTSTWSEPSSAEWSPTSAAESTETSVIGAAQYANGKGKTSTSASTPSASPKPDSGSSSGSGSHSGLLSVTDSKCGWCGSSPEYPNGSQEWINCGIDGSGWTPPSVNVKDLVAAELDASGPYGPCAPYFDIFKSAAANNGLPAILLAAIAMQESTCNPGATGANGEAGMMQIAQPNCNNNGGSCWDTWYNINRGAELLNQMIQHNNGNFFAAMGAYNGWQPGYTTISTATAAARQGNCFAQNNLDYVFQVVNGWMQNKVGYHIGTYFNLAHC